MKLIDPLYPPTKDSFDSYQSFIYKSRYARWVDEYSRRENWDDTIDRYLSFMLEHINTLVYLEQLFQKMA